MIPESSPSALPVQTTFRHLKPSAAVSERVESEAQKLLRVFPRITYCHTVIEAPHRHHQHGWHYAVHVELGVPHGRLVAGHEPGSRDRIKTKRQLHRSDETAASDKDVYVVLRHAFDSARRQLEEHARRLRGD